MDKAVPASVMQPRHHWVCNTFRCSLIQVLCRIRNHHAAWFVPSRNEWKPAYTPSDHARLLFNFSVFGYAQDRLARDALGRSECGGGFGEWQDGAHHRL